MRPQFDHLVLSPLIQEQIMGYSVGHPFQRSNRHYLSRWIMAALVLVAFAWRIQNLDGQSLWRDEIDAIYFALRDLPATLSMFVDTGQNGALYFFGLRPWLRLAGSTEFALRYPSVLLGVLSVPLLWRVSRRLSPSHKMHSESEPENVTGRDSGMLSLLSGLYWQETVGNSAMMAAIFLTINPYHLWYSQDGKMYSLISLLALLAVWFWLQAIDRGGWWPWLRFLITVSLAMYTHLLMVLLIPLFFIWFLISWPQSKRHWKGYLLALAGLTLPYLPLLAWQWHLLKANEQLTSLSFTPFSEVLRTIILYQSNSFLPPRSMVYLIPIMVLALAGLVAGYKMIVVRPSSPLPFLGARRRHLLIVSWLIVPVLTIHGLSLRQPVFLPRYVIWITPAAAMLMALGLQLVWRNRGALSKPLAAVIAIYVIAYWGSIGWTEKYQEIKTDLRSAVRYVHDRRQPDDLLIMQIPHLQYAYQYYTSDQGTDPFKHGDERLGWWAAGLSGQDGLIGQGAGQLIDKQMRGTTDGATDIWILLSEVDLVDPRHSMIEWLDQNMGLVNQVDFYATQIRHYRHE